MRVVALPWDGWIEGLGDARDMPLWSGRVGDMPPEATPIDPDATLDAPTLVVAGGTALGRHTLKEAWACGGAEGRDVAFRLGGRVGALAREVRQGATDGLWYLHPGAGKPDLDDRLAAAHEVELDSAEQSLQVWLPGSDPFAVSDRLFLPTRHWVHLLWANLMGLGPALWGALVGRSVASSVLRLAWASLRCMSVQPEIVASRLSRRGPGAWVHPTAVIEGAWLGPGARVGAGAVVRGAFLGEGAVVEDLAICEGVVAGPGAVVQRQALCKFSVLGPGARVSGAMQLGVLGAGASVKRGSYLMDQTLDDATPVRVSVGGALVPAPMGMTGVCVGPGTAIGSGVWVGPGRCLPPGVVIGHANPLLRPTLPEGEEGGAWVVRDGRLVRP